MRRGILRTWTMAVLCSLALAMIAPLLFSALASVGASPAQAADVKSLEVTSPGKKAPDKAATRLEDEVADNSSAEAKDSTASRESFLVWLYTSLKFRYVLIFLILTFNAVALIVMIVLGMRRSSICPDDLAAAFEAKLNQKQYQDAYELAKSDKSFWAKCWRPECRKSPKATTPSTTPCRKSARNKTSRWSSGTDTSP